MLPVSSHFNSFHRRGRRHYIRAVKMFDRKPSMLYTMILKSLIHRWDNFEQNAKMLKHPLSINTCLGTKDDLAGVWNLMKISSLLNVSNDASRKPEEFSFKDIEVIVYSNEQNWFKRAHIGWYLGIARIITSTAKLWEEDIRSPAFFQIEKGIYSMDPPFPPPPPLGKILRIMIFSSHLLVPFMSL